MDNPELMYDGLNSNELPLDCIESPFYSDARSMMNIKLCELLENLLSGDFQAGSVTLKLTLSTLSAIAEISEADNDIGGERQSHREYKQPEADYEIKLSLQRNSRETGKSSGKRAFIFRDGRYIAAPVPSDQVTFDELEKRRGF